MFQVILSVFIILATAKPKAKPQIFAVAPLAVAPAVVTAHSSQVFARNYNALVSPVVAAPLVAKAAPVVASAPVVAKAAPLVAAPALANAPLVTSPIVAKEAPVVAKAAPLVANPSLHFRTAHVAPSPYFFSPYLSAQYVI